MQGQLQYKVVGMMSGTSLDGIDLSLATYYKKGYKWAYDVISCKTYPYQKNDVNLLRSMEDPNISYLSFRQAEIKYSQIVVEAIQKFIQECTEPKSNINYIGFHGHTIFHSPSQGITVQAGNLQYIAAKLKMNLIGNFRELDVCRGGQGAPLAPFGQQLFGDGLYLNLGGIANIGYLGKGFDIVFCNMILNKYAQKISGQLFDRDGKLGESGEPDQQYLQQIGKIFSNEDNHSLAREEATQYLDQIKNSNQPKQVLVNKMRTFYSLISKTIVQKVNKIKCTQFNSQQKLTVYCTGGGAYNKFLITLLNDNTQQIQFKLPDPVVVQFKEALIFGLLAVKFVRGESNCLNGVGGQLVKGAS